MCVAFKCIRLQIVQLLSEALKQSLEVFIMLLYCLLVLTMSDAWRRPHDPLMRAQATPPSPPPSTTPSVLPTTSQQPADAQLNTKVRTLENVSTSCCCEFLS